MSNEKDNGLFIPNRQLSVIVAGSLLAFFMIFVAGYMVGQRTLISQIINEMDQDSFAAQIYTSLYTAGDYQDIGTEQSDGDTALLEDMLKQADKNSTFDSRQTANAPAQAYAKPEPVVTLGDKAAGVQNTVSHNKKSAVAMPSESACVVQSEVDSQSVRTVQEKSVEQQYYAQLIGFGYKKAAERFVSRLQEQGEPVELRTRVSTTASGNRRTWYQAVTKPYTNKQELDLLVDRIAQKEKLKDICIVSLS